MTQTEIEEYITQFPIYQYAFVKPEDIEFNDRVRQICKKECSRYGASWSCPPAVGTVEVCKERCFQLCTFLRHSQRRRSGQHHGYG